MGISTRAVLFVAQFRPVGKLSTCLLVSAAVKQAFRKQAHRSNLCCVGGGGWIE